MSSLVEICERLGYSRNGIRSRGNPILLRGDLQSFSDRMSWVSDLNFLADLYLCQNGRRMFQHSKCHLSYPTERDGILPLIGQAFRLLRGAPSDNDTQEGSGGYAEATDRVSNRNINRISSGQDDGDEIDVGAEVAHQFTETTLKDNSSKPIPDIEDMGAALSSSRSPVTTQTKKELVSIIQKWIENHPTQRFLEVANYDRFSFESNFAFEATLTDSGERVFILRLGIIEQYQGWVLEMSDGSFMLVKAQFQRNKGGHVYYPWLGGDHGFSNDEVAHHRELPKQKLTIRGYARAKRLDPEDVLNEYDITKYDLEADTAKTTTEDVTTTNEFGAPQDSDSSLTSLSSVAPLMNGWKARKAGESQPLNETTGRKRHRSTGKLPIRSRKAIKAVSEEDDAVPQKVSRSDSEPLALELLERYYLSEQPTASNQLRRHGLTSSPESPPPPAAAPPTTQSPLPPPPSKTTTAGNRVVLETPPASIPPTTGPSNSPIPNPPHTETTTTTTTTAHRRRATFHFYLSDPTLGAVPHSYPLNALPSRSTFFHNAIAAHDMVSTPGQVVAASVRVVCARGPSERPIVVPKDAGGKAAWGELLRVIGAVMGRKEEVAGGGGKVECEVRCIAAR